jgi:hypothetical protein
MEKLQAFDENTKLLQNIWGIVPLRYGSLGLERLTGRLCRRTMWMV